MPYPEDDLDDDPKGCLLKAQTLARRAEEILTIAGREVYTQSIQDLVAAHNDVVKTGKICPKCLVGIPIFRADRDALGIK